MKTTKFFTAIVLAVAILFSACNKTESGDTDVNNDQNQTEVEVPDYTYDEETKTYTVYTANGLLAWNVAVQDTLSLNCTLARDIDLTEVDWENTPWSRVGTNTNPYTGTFEGSNHTITGLTINQSETSYVGLIGYLGSGGKVQNLTLDNVNITGYSYVGGVVGGSYGGTVTNYHSTGSVNGYDAVGGVVGGDENGSSVTACYSTGSVNGYDTVGGVVGYVYRGTVTACYRASGSVNGSGSYLGGVVGLNNQNNSTVTACYYSDYDGSGIGSNGSGEATLVDGETVYWSDAVTDMNNALQTNQSDWRYELLTGNDYPTLTKISSE